MQIGLTEILLIAAGIVSFFIVYTYRYDKDSALYKVALILGLIAGVAIIASAATHYKDWTYFDSGLVFVAGFTLVIRPFRKAELAVLAALVAMVAAYFYLGTLTGDLSGLSEGTPRIVLTIIVGALLYMVLHFIEKVADLVGNILNMWPVLLAMGIVCIVEAVLIIFNGTSLFDYIQEYRSVIGAVEALIY